MKVANILKAWGRILAGHRPAMSLEITRSCPLHCAGCYAFGENHIGGEFDSKIASHHGQQLVEETLELVKCKHPLHLSIVGGEPLLRRNELATLLPQLNRMGLNLQLVTSAVLDIPEPWKKISRLEIVVSVDGLPDVHDRRRFPATYERILRNIEGHRVVIHCTVTGPMADRPGYLEEFVRFWSGREETRKIWISFYTPQVGESSAECLSLSQKEKIIQELLQIRRKFPKLNMRDEVIRQILHPPASPDACLFSRSTLSIAPDLKTEIVPCSMGGNPDCRQCGCIAAIGLAYFAQYRLLPGISVEHFFNGSSRIGKLVQLLGV